MSDNEFFNLGKEAGAHMSKRIQDDWVPAVTGIERGAGVYSLRGDSAHNDKLPTNQVYVRTAPGIGNGMPFPVSNTAVGLKANLDVFIRKMSDGHWEIVGVNTPNATNIFGEAAMDYGAPPATGHAPNLTPGRDFYPGRVIIWKAGTLQVNLSEPYPYTASDGSRAVWTATNANTLDISGSVPSSAQQRYTQIALNPDVTTPVLVAFNGTAQSLAMPLAVDAFKSIAVTSGYIILDAVLLKTGDVDETTVTESRWKYGRVSASSGLATPVSIANGGTGQTSASAAFDALSPTTTKGDVIVDSGTVPARLAVGTNGQVLTANSAATNGVDWESPGSGAYYQTVQGNGSAATQQPILDFIDGTNTTVAITDDGAGTRTKVAVNASLAGTGTPNNVLINGTFDFAQRQTPGTLTTIATDTYGADRWRMSNQNASCQYQRNDATSETGLTSLNYGLAKQITNTGKFMVYQIIEGDNSLPLRSRAVTFQIMLKTDSARTFRIGIVELQNAGAINTIPATFISAYGANTVDPTLGANLAYIGTNVSCSVTTSWTLFSVTQTIPSNSKNVIAAVWSDSGVVANGTLSMAQAQLIDGSTTVAWLPRPAAQELAMCQRYFEKSYDIDIAPGTSGSNNGISSLLWGAAFTSTMRNTVQLKASKFSVPAMLIYDGVGAVGKVFRGANGKTGTIPIIGMSAFSVQTTDATSANEFNFHWSAAAEL